MNDMLERYGEVCPQIKAAQILSDGAAPQSAGLSRPRFGFAELANPPGSQPFARTIARMADDGRLRRVGAHIDVRSICHYIENDEELNFRARYRKRYPILRDDSSMADGEFYAASRRKRSH